MKTRERILLAVSGRCRQAAENIVILWAGAEQAARLETYRLGKASCPEFDAGMKHAFTIMANDAEFMALKAERKVAIAMLKEQLYHYFEQVKEKNRKPAAEPTCTCSGSETGAQHAEWCFYYTAPGSEQ